MHFYSGYLNTRSKLHPRKCTKYISSFSTPTFSSSSACWSHPSHLRAKVGYSQEKLCYRVCQPSTFEWPFPYTFYDLLKHMRYSHMSKHPTYPPVRVTFAGVYPSYLGVKVEFHPSQGKNLHSLLQASLCFWLGEAGVSGEHIETLREHGTLHSTAQDQDQDQDSPSNLLLWLNGADHWTTVSDILEHFISTTSVSKDIVSFWRSYPASVLSDQHYT